MNVISIAYKNLKRKKIRSALTIGGVAIAVAVLVSLLGFDRGYQQSLTANIDNMGYQLLVTAKGFGELEFTERQDLVWRMMDREFTADEQLRISMILTMPPDEARGQ